MAAKFRWLLLVVLGLPWVGCAGDQDGGVVGLPPASDDDVCRVPPALPKVIRAANQSVRSMVAVGDRLFFVLQTWEGSDLHLVQSLRTMAADGSGERTLLTLPAGVRTSSPPFVQQDRVFLLLNDPAGPGGVIQSVPVAGGPAQPIATFRPAVASGSPQIELFAADQAWLYLAVARAGLYRLAWPSGTTTLIAKVAGAIHDPQLADGQIWYRGDEDQKVYRVPADASEGAITTVMVPGTCRHRALGGALYCGGIARLTRFDPQTGQLRSLIDIAAIYHPQVPPVFEPLDYDGTYLYVVERRSGAAGRDLRRVHLTTFKADFVACALPSLEQLRVVPGGVVFAEILFGGPTVADQLVRLDLPAAPPTSAR